MVISILHNLCKVESENFFLYRYGHSHSSEYFEPINLVPISLLHDDDEIIHASLHRMTDTFLPVVVGVDVDLFVHDAHETV